MEDKHIFYDYEGRTLKIPVSEQKNFEKDIPSAKMLLTYDGHNLAVPLSELKSFAKDVGKENISYSVYNDKNEYVPEASTDKYLSYEGPSLGESVAKATGSAGVRTGKRMLNLLHTLSAGTLYNDPETGAAKRLEDIDTQLKDETNTFRNASILAGETADRLSREADPTGGQEGFVDLMAKGQIGKALQKGVVTTIESLPQTLSAYNPITMGLNAAAMAAENYVESTLDNPEMEKWKRATYAVGTAAFEQAVEKFADPLFKYIGGGKAAKGLTEDTAKKLIDNVTRQATDDMAERIFAGLGKIGLNVAKDAGGEGLEEVITSFGNDALGEALDAIDGDKDFGIRAQWQKMKEENPDADMWDFAKAKAKEYADAFIGGALSGGMMSGPTQLITGGADMVHKEVAIRTMENSRELGSKLDLNNMYDMNEKVNETLAKTSEAFAGEEDKPAISGDFFANLSADEAFALSESEDITTEQKEALENLANVKAAQEGLDQKLDDRINEKINSLAAIANEASDNGYLIFAVHNGKAVFVKGAACKKGIVTLPDGSDGPVVIVNETTGEKSTVPSNEIQNAAQMSTEEYNSNIANAWRVYDKNARDIARNTMSVFAKQREIMPYAGKKILVNLGNGPVEVYVQQITDNGEVTLKGNKGDLGGQSIITLNAGTFYDSIHRDDTGNPVITEVKEGEVEEQPVEPETKPEAVEVAPSGQQDYREQVVTILINGKPVQVEVTGQDNTADRITYEYTDENGVRRSGGSSIAEFESAITTPIETAPEVEPEIPTKEPVAEVEPEAPAEVPVTPEVINWDALLETEPDAYFAEMQKRFGDKTANRINAVVTVLQKEIDSLNKANPKTQEEIFENEDRKEALQAKIDSLNGMIERLNAPAETAPEVATEPVAETPVAEEPVAEEEPVTPLTEEAPVEEQPVAEQPVVEQTPEPVIEEPAPSVPVAPTPVANPVDEALKREESLIPQLERKDIGRNQRRDMAYNAGKTIADMFATREEYEAYEAVASDLGEFNDDFERGVNDSFANRNQTQNIGESEGNSVPLGTEPNGEQDGRQSEQTDGEDTIRQGDDIVGRGSDDGGVETTNTGDKETEQELGKGESETVEEVKKEYPARKGNATKKILIDTFGFSKVSIPNTESTVLNTVYDFMMEMAKMLGVSPNVIGNGGWLDVANLRSNANASAAYSWKNRPDGEVVEPRLRLKYGRISSIAHEWWHSLDHVLKFFNTSKGRSTATANISLLDSFGVRKEVQMALADLLKAMKDSGFEHRIASMRLPFKYKYYLLENEEMTARAFDAYINDKFESAGIEVENAVYEKTPYQPTPEEMEVIAPAFDNLFKVLKEKEGKKAGTSVLYQIGGQLDNNSDAKKFATDSVLKMLAESGIDVSTVTDEQVEEMLRVRAELSNAPFELMTVFHGSGNKFDKFDHSHMGEGEGAQAHGWGTYVALNKSTSVGYASRMSGGNRVFMNGKDVTETTRVLLEDPYVPEAYLVSQLKMYGSIDAVRERINFAIIEQEAEKDYFEFEKDYNDYYYQSVLELEKLNKAKELLESNTWTVEEAKAQLYTVEIPEDDDSNYLTEDGRMSEGEVDRLYNACEKEGIDFLDVITPETKDDGREGKQIYSNLSRMLGSDKAASEFLSRAGFVGIKYNGRVDGECFVIFNESDAKITGRTEFYQTPNGTVYGWTDGKKIYLTEAGINPNTPVHEYTHLWAKAMMQKNPKGWNSVKALLKDTPVWDEVLNDSNYSDIHNDEDAVASEVLSRISGSENALKLEQMAQQMIDEAKGTMRKLEAQGLIQRIKDALNEFWKWVGVELFGIENFESVEQITDRVLWDLMNKTNLNADFGIEIKTADSDRSGVISGTTSSTSLSIDGKQHLSTHHLAQQKSDANLQTNFGIIKRKVQKFINGGYEIKGKEKIKTETQLVQKLADIFGFEKSDTSISYYGEYETSIEVDGKKYKVRLSNHRASGEWMSKGDFDERVSLVIEDAASEGRKGGDKYFVEYVTEINNKHNVDDIIKVITDSVFNLLNGERVERKLFDEFNMRNVEYKIDDVKEEMESIKKIAEKNGTFMKAPNGNPTNLNEEQWLLVRTDGFKAWFGDWEDSPETSSKVVDENGEPLVVYHGSPYGNITEFNRKGHSVSGLREFGTYFGSNRRLAELYAYARQQAKGDVEKYELEKAKIDAIIFDPETPPRVALDAFDELDKLNESQKPKVYEVFLNIRNPKEFDAERSDGYRGWHKLKQDVGYDVKTGVEAIEAIAGHNRAARMSEKYDGIIAHNMADVHHEEGLDELMGDVFLVFDETPSNIKSADGNFTFNPDTENILYNISIDPDTVAQETAKQTYDRVIKERWQEFQRQFQDAYQPVRIALDAIQNETGNIPIEDYENYLLIQNLSSSRSRVEIDTFSRRFYSPIIDHVNKIISQLLEARGLDVENKENRAEVYQEVIHYLIAKHGLERNEYFQKTRKRPLNKEEREEAKAEEKYKYEEELNRIASLYKGVERVRKEYEAKEAYEAALIEIKSRTTADIRDYSGLTALFELEPTEFDEAQASAEILVKTFEYSLGRKDTTDSLGNVHIHQSKIINQLWNKINAATDKTLQHSYESGMLSRKQYEEISKMFEFYIPLRGFDENTAEDIYAYARFEGNRFNPAVHKAKGRTSLADDPIATIMNMAESEITQGNKNKAKQALYNYILNRPVIGPDGKQMQNSLMQIESVWYVVSKDENGNDIHQIAAPDHEGGETYEAFENRMQALAKDGKAYKSKKGGVDVGVRFQKPANRNAHYVYLKINGVDKAIYINGDPKAADAINGTYKQKPLPKAKIKIGDREISVDLGAIHRNISSTFTNYSLEFTARNFIRDMFYSHINMDIKESDPEYRKKFRQNWRNNIFNMLPMLKAYRSGEFDNRELTEDEAAFVEFMGNGGQTGYTVINSVEARKIELENAIKRMQEGVEKGGLKDSTIFKATLGGVELLNEASELITRFAAYKTSRDMGRSVVKSINDAKEITVNFNTKGAQDGTGLFGKAAQYLGWSKYFFNASVQGVQNITAMAKADKLKFCTTVGTIMATGFMMPVLVAAISAIFGGDDEEEYWNIPEYDRQNNLCIPVGGTYVKLPLPIGFREMYAMGDMIAAMAFDKKFSRDAQQVGMDMANKVASIVLPINPLEGSVNGLNIWASIGTILGPSSAQFLIQNATNTDWKGAPLQKEYTYNENDPQWMKAYASNPLWMKSLSKWCNETLGTGDMKGVDWSPEKLDNTLSNLFGGIYTLTKKLGKTLSMAWNEDNRKMSNVPLAGVVLGTGINSDDAFVTDAYFEMKEYYDDRIGFIKKRAEKFGYDLDEVFLKGKGKHHPKMQDIYNNKTFDFMQEWYKGNEELKELQNAVKKIEKQIAEKEKPSEALINKLLKAKMELEIERREFVNDMLEFD